MRCSEDREVGAKHYSLIRFVLHVQENADTRKKKCDTNVSSEVNYEWGERKYFELGAWPQHTYIPKKEDGMNKRPQFACHEQRTSWHDKNKCLRFSRDTLHTLERLMDSGNTLALRYPNSSWNITVRTRINVVKSYCSHQCCAQYLPATAHVKKEHIDHKGYKSPDRFLEKGNASLRQDSTVKGKSPDLEPFASRMFQDWPQPSLKKKPGSVTLQCA